MAEQKETITLVRLGMCELRNGKPGVKFHVVLGEKGNWTLSPDELVFGNTGGVRKYLKGMPGSMYRVPLENKGETGGMTISSGEAEFIGLFPDVELRAEWHAVDQARQDEMTAKRDAKKLKKSDPIIECLKPIRAAYYQARGSHRNYILARAVRYIITGD
jgi:hypothetical protein